MTTIKQTAGAAQIPTGEYTAKFVAFVEEEGQFGPQLKATIQISEGELKGETMTAWASKTFSPKSKLYSWAQAVFGKDIPANYDLDTDHLLNRPFTAVIVVKPAKDGTGEFSRLDNAKALKRNGAAQAPKPAPKPAPAPVAESEEPTEVPF